MQMKTSAKDIIQQLDLAPHPEGGYYRRTYQSDTGQSDTGQSDTGIEERGYATAIYYLLEGTEFALWHRVDADEIWFWHAGGTLTLQISEKGQATTAQTLGYNVMAGESPQVLVPAHAWQRARSNSDWTLVSCCVSPGFLFETYDLATPEFDPQNSREE